MPTEAKVRLLDALVRTGVRRIEAVSFVHPKAIPQMADADEVWAAAAKVPGVRYSALVPNPRGAQRALAAGFTEIEVVVSASDTHNRHNVNRSTDGVARRHRRRSSRTVHEAGAPVRGHHRDQLRLPVRGRRRRRPGSRPSSTGWSPTAPTGSRSATPPAWPRPRRVQRRARRGRAPARRTLPLLLHFHNTRGTALANILTALELGITEFDASVGGLGGCPTRRARPATWPPRRSCTCCTTWASTPASTSRR